MHGQGAKGSVKNRIYQFWLIQLFIKRKKKKQEIKELKKRELEERRKKVYQEMFEVEEVDYHFKLSKAPTVFQKKEGIKITLYPIGKKPDKVIEVFEEKKRIGIGDSKEEVKVKKELTEIAHKTEVIVKDTKEKAEKKANEPKEIEEKKKALESNLSTIEGLKKEYQTIIKKNPKAENMIVTVEPLKKELASNSISKLSETEKICKEELKRVTEVLVAMPLIKDVTEKKKEEAEKKKQEESKRQDGKTEEKENQKQSINSDKKNIKEEKKVEIVSSKEQINQKTNKIEEQTIYTSEKVIIDGPVKKGVIALTLTGGTVIAFPALVQKVFNKEKQNPKSVKTEEIKSKDVDNKEKIQGNQEKIKSENEKQEKEKHERVENEERKNKLKLYRNKLEASKEAEILIKSEIKRQKDYLKNLNEKVGKLDVTVRTKYQFRGIHHLVANVLKFAIGVLTIPFSKKRIFGTAVGLTLIGNSIRGIRNSFRSEENKIAYIELKDFSKKIYSEQMALLKTKHLIVDSLGQLKDLKSELEEQYYGKISSNEYDEMLDKLNSIEQTLLSKQKEIVTLEEGLTKAEEKNKVKVKQIEEMQSRH